MPKVKLHTSLDPRYSCAICGVSVDGMTPASWRAALFDQYKIHTVGIVWENISCVRVTPHVYTTIADLDKLVLRHGSLDSSRCRWGSSFPRSQNRDLGHPAS
jgi:selenocysteine lyase/cysteine desulfurase